MAKPILTLPCKYTLSDLGQKDGQHHCKACDHSIRDFRNATGEEISRAIAESDQRTCGIFYPAQVSHKTTTYQLGIQRRVGLSLLGILGFISPVALTSCDETTSVPETNKDVSKEDAAFAQLKFPMIVSGYLRDKANNDPLAMSEISICQNNTIIRTVKTDTDGFFTVKLEKKDLSSADFDLVIERLSYKPDTVREIGHLAKEDRTHLVLKLEAYPKPVAEPEPGCEQPFFLGDIVTTVTLGVTSGHVDETGNYQEQTYPNASDLSRLIRKSKEESFSQLKQPEQ
jgi:hypothetical protein